MFDSIKNYFAKPAKEQIFTWKYIDIDKSLVDEIQDIYLKHLDPDLSNYCFFQATAIKVPNVLGIKVKHCCLVYSKGNEKPQFSHKDPIVDSTFALNIPLKNCENSITRLYKDNKKPMYAFTTKGRLTEVQPIEKSVFLTSYVLDKPLLFNTQILHSVENFSPEPRLAISLRFKKNPMEWL